MDTVHPRFICTICTKVMKDPHLMVCCGMKYCAVCLNNWLAKKKRSRSCPHCRATTFQNVLEKGMKSEIESFNILCPNHKIGCEWIGELRNLDSHMKSGCDYYELDCPNNCISLSGFGSTKIIRKIMKEHLSKHCIMRKVKCQHCDYVCFAKMLSNHERSCKMLPVKCPNSCGEEGIVRQSLEPHLAECKLELVPCARAEEGCQEKFQRHCMREHLTYHCEFHSIRCEYCEFTGPAKTLSEHASECKMFPVKCPNDCGEEGLVLQTLDEHLLVCKLEVVPCERASEGCKEKFQRQFQQDHMDFHCEFRTVKCEYCNYSEALQNLSFHISKCMMFPTPCPNGCNEQGIVRQTLTNHLRVCSLTDVHCEYLFVGCTEQVKREDLSQHMADYQGKHLELMNTAYSKRNTDLEESQQTVKKVRNVVLKEMAARKRSKSETRQETLLFLKILLDCSPVKKVIPK